MRIILQEIPLGDYRRCLVVKSNFYGYGYAMISYLEKYVDCIVVASLMELEFVKKQNPNLKKDFIVLYANLYEHHMYYNTSNVYGTIMSEQQLEEIKLLKFDRSRFFLRSNLFLGLHGLDLSTCLEEVDGFKGLLIHVNEYLDQDELEQLIELDNFLCMKNITLNLGGSITNNYFAKLHSKIEYRFAKKVLFDYIEKKSNFCLHLQVINVQQASYTKIGYKSCQERIKSGWIYLVSIGYGDWPLLSRIYETNTKLTYQGNEMSLPVYPCMNTCWLYSQKQLEYTNSSIVLFQQKKEILDVCRQLDIDSDEFTSSFSSNIKRIYIMD